MFREEVDIRQLACPHKKEGECMRKAETRASKAQTRFTALTVWLGARKDAGFMV